ncbi:MAG: NapC/NirT family cytochrome c [Deltaproteobacteria bacterium]|nr:NapC/NirT family cytochrome c [Deltaproteobacteria bacterium]
MDLHRLLALATLVSAGAAAVILLVFLIRRPPLSTATKAWLFLGIGVFPIATAFTGNVAGYQWTKQREFCSSCHLMVPYAKDAESAESTSLTAMHSRNHLLGEESCYNCHRDYRLFGAVTTKLTGMRHLYSALTHPPAKPRLFKPFPSGNCVQCHSTRLTGFQDEPEHGTVAEEIKAGTVDCVASGCHGPAHPFAHPEELEQAGGEAPGPSEDMDASPRGAADAGARTDLEER